MDRIKNFLKSEIVLTLSFVLAAVSIIFVKPNLEYIDYIDFKTLSLLFCLMAVMAGFNSLGIFRLLAEKLLGYVKTTRGIGVVMCLLCFFSSMIITNDVALITFVPFTIVVLKMIDRMKMVIPLITFETVAANLGSMLTPIGNPQNLYLFSAFKMSIADFIYTIFPYALLSFTLIVISSVLIKSERISQTIKSDNNKINIGLCIMYCVLFLLALLTVFRVLHYLITLVISFVVLVITDRSTLKKVDYSLLLTFVFLFVFIGNLGNIAPVSNFLQEIVSDNEVLVGVAASQIFSNVPAAILLSGFTENVKDLLIGVNLGGLGTIIASMASLISYKFIIKEGVKPGKYLLFFTVINIIFLALNIAMWIVLELIY